MISISGQQLELFMSLFRGRTDVYARRWGKDGRSGYGPAYDFNWDEFIVHKRRGGSMKDFKNKKLVPLTKEVVKKHLIGQHVVGLYPIFPNNASYFIAADFDGENWLKDSGSFLQHTKKSGSRRILNAHVWEMVVMSGFSLLNLIHVIRPNSACPHAKNRRIGVF